MQGEVTAKAGQAYIGIDRVTGAIQFSVPHGTKLADAIKALSTIDVSRIPRGCEACLCGLEFKIRERFDPVINVELGRARQP